VPPCLRGESWLPPLLGAALLVTSAFAFQDTGSEAALWAEIETLAALPPAPTSQPYADRFAQLRRARESLRERLRLYQMLYPGGAHRDDAVTLELQTLFELGSLAADDLAALRARIAELRRQPPSQTALQEAEYWALLCDKLIRPAPPAELPTATRPAPAADESEEAWLAACRGYLARFPDARHVPRIVDELAVAACRRSDLAELQALVTALAAKFPDHAVTRRLQARVRLQSAVTTMFHVEHRCASGEKTDTRTALGRPVLVAVWPAADVAGRTFARDVEQFRRDHPDVHVVGVCVAGSPDAVNSAAETLELAWPQVLDEAGRDDSLSAQWGLSRLPQLLAIDRQGKLLGIADRDGWRDLAERALAPPQPAAD